MFSWFQITFSILFEWILIVFCPHKLRKMHQICLALYSSSDGACYTVQALNLRPACLMVSRCGSSVLLQMWVFSGKAQPWKQNQVAFTKCLRMPDKMSLNQTMFSTICVVVTAKEHQPKKSRFHFCPQGLAIRGSRFFCQKSNKNPHFSWPWPKELHAENTKKWTALPWENMARPFPAHTSQTYLLGRKFENLLVCWTFWREQDLWFLANPSH